VKDHPTDENLPNLVTLDLRIPSQLADFFLRCNKEKIKIEKIKIKIKIKEAA
jgi:hypothetical protein